MPYLKKIPIDKMPEHYKSRLRAITEDKYFYFWSGLGGTNLNEAIKELEENKKHCNKQSCAQSCQACASIS